MAGIFWTLVGLVVLTPLPLASVYMWSWALMGCTVGLLLAAWGTIAVVSRQTPAVGLSMIWPVAGLFTLAAVWAALQGSLVTPAEWHHPLWKSAGEVLELEVTSRITVDPFRTYSALLRLLTYAGIFWLSLQFCRSRARAQQVFIAIALAGLVYAAYGLFVEFSGTQMVLWFKKTAYIDNVTSTFVNRNSYATYAGLGLVCATGMILRLFAGTADSYSSRREALRVSLTNLFERGWIFIIAWFVICVALLLSDSRGGFLSTAVGLIMLFVAAAATRSREFRFSRKAAAVFLMVGIGFIAFSGGTVLDRLAEATEGKDIRPQIYERTIDAIHDAPWLGTGYGTYDEIFRIYRTSSFPVTAAKAHNTYLENALELGIPASVALVLAVLSLGLLCAVGVRRRRRDAIYPCIGVAATALVGAHSFVDFSLQIPAVTATYCLLMGAACAQSWSSRRKTETDW